MDNESDSLDSYFFTRITGRCAIVCRLTNVGIIEAVQNLNASFLLHWRCINIMRSAAVMFTKENNIREPRFKYL